MTNGSLMKVKSIAECSLWSILQYFWPALSDNCAWKPIFGLFFWEWLLLQRFYCYHFCVKKNVIPLLGGGPLPSRSNEFLLGGKLFGLNTEEITYTVNVQKLWTLRKLPAKKALKNSADPDQTASSDAAVWSGSSLFAFLTGIFLWILAKKKNQHFIWEQKEKSVLNFRTFTVTFF